MNNGQGDKPYDPFEAWRGLRDASMEVWAKVMTDAVRTDANAQSTGAMLDTYLTASAPFYEAMQKVIAQTLQELNLPSRADMANFSERLTNIEKRLDDMDAKLDSVLARLSHHGQSNASKAARKEGGINHGNRSVEF
jgi:polyhydroxyalkanoic acid synthase PhaR subunit